MPKGYWIGRIDVIKPEYTKAYGPALAAVLRKYDAKFKVRGAPSRRWKARRATAIS